MAAFAGAFKVAMEKPPGARPGNVAAEIFWTDKHCDGKYHKSDLSKWQGSYEEAHYVSHTEPEIQTLVAMMALCILVKIKQERKRSDLRETVCRCNADIEDG